MVSTSLTMAMTNETDERRLRNDVKNGTYSPSSLPSSHGIPVVEKKEEEPVRKLQISVCAEDLKSVRAKNPRKATTFARLSKITFDVTTGERNEEIIGSTERVNSLSPHWKRHFYHDHRVSNKCSLRIVVYDSIVKGIMLRHSFGSNRPHDPRIMRMQTMGSVVVNLSEALVNNGSVKVPMKGDEFGRGGGVVIVSVVEMENHRDDVLSLHLRGADMRFRSSVIDGKTRHYFEVLRKERLATGDFWRTVYQSDLADHSYFPYWKSFDLALVNVDVDGDLEAAIRVEVKSITSRKQKRNVGFFEASMEDIVAHRSSRGNGDLTNAFMLHDKNGEKVGHIVVVNAHITNPSLRRMSSIVTTSSDRRDFFDNCSVLSGVDVGLRVAIDFTENNGELHHDHSQFRSSILQNEYEKALFATENILAQFHSKTMYPIWGFGALHKGTERRIFELEGRERGVLGFLNAYRDFWNTPYTQGTDPSFVEIIREASQRAFLEEKERNERSVPLSHYSILLILTAGHVRDSDDAANALRDAAKAPLSVLIVGMGDDEGNFAELETLDDELPFLKLCDYENVGAFTETCVEKVNRELVDYFRSRGKICHVT